MAADTLALMKEYSPDDVAWFTEALKNKDLKAIASNYLYYIALSEAGSEAIIAEALLKYGSKQMGLDCLNCGSKSLDAAARKWASRHNYRVYQSSKGSGAYLQWEE